MNPLPKPRALLFDWDNTLVDTWPTIHEALNRTLRYMNHPQWSLDKVKANVKKSMRDSFPELFGDDWQRAASHYQEGYRAIHLTSLHPLPDAERLLHAIPQDIFTAIVSNKKGPTLREEVTHIGWNPLFDVAIGADDAARDKPFADPAKLALTNFSGAHDATIWFVGDTVVDLACAAAIGATPILYGVHATDGAMLDGHGFAAHVKNHRQLMDLLTDVRAL